jgi:hypothetical protein
VRKKTVPTKKQQYGKEINDVQNDLPKNLDAKAGK